MMERSSLFKQSIKFVLKDVIGDFLYFPIWWYTVGIKKISKIAINKIKETEEAWAFRVWFKNLFVPMYADYTWDGRLISFFMRLVQIIIRGSILLALSLFFLILALVFVLLPIVAVWEIIFNFGLLLE